MTVDRLSLFDARTSSADDGRCSEGTKNNKVQIRRKARSNMRRDDQTGPQGQEPGTGRGVGGGGGRGRGGGHALGFGGYGVCPSCGERAKHQMGVPCFEQKCPNYGALMTRE